MKIVRRDPFAEWLPFRPFLRDWSERLHWPGTTLRLEEDEFRVEEFTEHGALVIRAEMPGIDPENDLDVQVAEGWLTIRAQRNHDEEKKARNYFRREIHHGSVVRSLPLPADAKEDQIKATYIDGILRVAIPLGKHAAADKAKKIIVKRAG